MVTIGGPPSWRCTYFRQATNENFSQEVLASEQPVLVFFDAECFDQCRLTALGVKDIEEEYKEKCKIIRFDVNENRTLFSNNVSKKYKIDTIPRLVLFKDGKIIDQIIGLATKYDIKPMLDKIL